MESYPSFMNVGQTDAGTRQMGEDISKFRSMFLCRVLCGNENSTMNSAKRDYKNDIYPDDGYDSNVRRFEPNI